MSAPIIDGTVPASPITFTPGQTKQIQIVAHDPDNGPPVSQRFTVTDGQGNVTPIMVTLQEQDTISYSVDPPPSGWTIVQQADPSKFNITAPA